MPVNSAFGPSDPSPTAVTTLRHSDTQWGCDHWNLIEAFVFSEFDMLTSSKVECTAKFMRLLSTCSPRLGSQMEPSGN